MRYINQPANPEPTAEQVIDQNISGNLNNNIENLRILLDACSDAVMRFFTFGKNPQTRGMLIYFDGLVDRNEVENNLLRPLMLSLDMLNPPADDFGQQDVLQEVQNKIVTMVDLKMIETLQQVCHHISSGDTVLLLEGYPQGLAVGTRSWQSRSVQTPDNEVVIFGPKEGFTETLRFNTAMLRRRLKSTRFKIEGTVLGRITKTDVALCYIEKIAPPALVNEVRERIEKIDLDGVLDTNYIKESIVDHNKSLFSQVQHTEKPDRVCGQLLEGRVALLVDGSPMALVLPISFSEFITSPEDYYTHFIPASLFRLLRFVAFWLALLLPSLYVSVISYHHEMVPTALLLTIAATREGVPFPAFVEAFVLEATFEMLREAGLRLPRAIGPAVSIVGALIIGDAAVRAGLVSTPMVVVVAATGIASFVSPSFNAGLIVRIARFGFLAASALLGFLGIMILLVIMLTRMVSLSSFGHPYLTPFAPLNLAQLSDIMVRRPWFVNTNRPYLEGMENQTRQGNPGQKGS